MITAAMRLLSSQSGSLIYHLILLLVLEAGLFIVWGQWRRSRDAWPTPGGLQARVQAIALLGILGLRGLLIVAALLTNAWQGMGSALMPPLERAVDVVSLGLLAWAFVPALRDRPALGSGLLLANTLAAGVLFIIMAALWSDQIVGGASGVPDYHSSSQESIWVIWQLAICLAAIILLWKDPVKDPARSDTHQITLVAFGALFLGYGMHLLVLVGLLAPYPAPNVPAWARLGHMIAYPLFVIVVYKTALANISSQSEQLLSQNQTSLEQIKGLVNLFEASRKIGYSLDLAQVLQDSAQSVASALKADQCAIGLLEEAQPGQLRLAAVYNPTRQTRHEGISLPLSQHKPIEDALQQLRQVQLNGRDDSAQLRILYSSMGSDQSGPLIIQPLAQQDTPVGILLLGNGDSGRTFSASEAQLCRTLASQVTVAIANARAHQDLEARAQTLAASLRSQEAEVARQRAAMESSLKKSREEVALFAQRIYDRETSSKSYAKALEEARTRLATLEALLKRSQAALEQVTREKDSKIQVLSGEIKARAASLGQLEAERDALAEKVKGLEHEAAQAERLADALAQTRERTRKLARAVRRAQRTSLEAGLISQGGSAQTLLEDLTCGVIIGDAHGKISLINSAASQMLGASPEALVNEPLGQVTQDEGWQRAIATLNATAENVVTNLQLGDRVLRATISPLAATLDGEPQEGSVAILYDVTADATSQQARDEFIASLSQELRTPMTSIIGYTDLLLGESVGLIGDIQRKFLQRIKANIERMQGMLNDLIGVTAIDSGRLEIRPTTLNMSAVIEDTIIDARTQLEEKELILELKLPEHMPLVEVDPESAHQIMANLLSNAAKCSPVGSTIEVTAQVYADEGADPDLAQFLKISIRDSGGGIAPEDHERVFDRFYRAEKPLINGLGDTGVGLAIVRSLVERNGGRVWVESEMGAGSTFSFLLPLSRDHDDPWLEVDIPPLDLSSDLPEEE